MGIVSDIEISGLVEEREKLNALLTSDSTMEKNIRIAIGRALNRARTEMEAKAQSALASDPRAAHKAIKRIVYRRILGGAVSILDRKGHGAQRLIEPHATLREGQRGGNRIPRSKRTLDLMSYYGSDRAFILRFHNFGTGDRKSRYGNRGSLSSNEFFVDGSTMENAVDELAQYIEEEYNKILKNG